MVEETKREMFGKVNNLEARVEKEGKRLVEMEKYSLRSHLSTSRGT